MSNTRYEVTLAVKTAIEAETQKYHFYKENDKYYINDDTRWLSIQYQESDGQGDYTPTSKTLDEICQKLYTTDFDAQSTEGTYESVDTFQLKNTTASKGIPKVAVVKPDGDDFISIVSHEFTTKTSWYGESTRVTGETLTGSGVGPYSATNDYWIDMTSGNVIDEDIIGIPYFAKIYDDGIEQTNGFTIDYEAGEVTFDSTPTGPVTADYSYAGSSTWTLKPDAGKIVNIKHAELDFTIDSDLHKVHFEIWAYNPYDLPNKVLINRRTYKNIKDVVKIANEIQVIDALGGIGQKLVRAVFDYAEIIELKDSQGIELRVKIDDDVPFTGTFSSVTVYTTIEDE